MAGKVQGESETPCSRKQKSAQKNLGHFEIEKNAESDANNTFSDKQNPQRHVERGKSLLYGRLPTTKGMSNRIRISARHHFAASSVITGSGQEHQWLLKPQGEMLGSRVFTVSN